MDPQAPGNPHGKQSFWRWDPSTAACLIVLVALAWLAYVHLSLRGTAGISVGRR
jgi:hypothetical protein